MGQSLLAENSAHMQYEWCRLWKLSSSGLLLMSWDDEMGSFMPVEYDILKVYNDKFELLFRADLGMTIITYSTLGQQVLRAGTTALKEPHSDAARHLTALYRDQNTLTTLRLAHDAPNPRLLSIDWSACMGCLVLANESYISMDLYYKQQPELPWHTQTLYRGVFGVPDDNPRSHIVSAAWSPDARSIILLSSSKILVWCTTAAVISSCHSLEAILHDLPSPLQDCWLRIAPCGRIVAILDRQSLVLYNVQMPRVRLLSRFVDKAEPISMRFSAAGDKLMVLRGKIWLVISFGGVKRMVSHGHRMCDLLEYVNTTAGTLPSVQHASGFCEEGCCDQPKCAGIAETGQYTVEHVDGQRTLGCCQGWDDNNFNHPCF